MSLRQAARAMLVAAAILAGATAPGAQISPGPLSRAHAELDSPLKCLECHGSARDAMDGKCLACHTDVEWLRARGRGLHGRIADRMCATCHPDHAGADFDLIQWPEGAMERFDHAGAGFALSGKHAGLDCAKCHQAAKLSPALMGLGRHDPSGKRWTGLDPHCASCHADDDIHRGALGTGCATCHGQDHWKPATAFDHARTAYPLTGKHAAVACAACHQAARLRLPLDRQGRPVPIYRPLPHKECSDCHADPHEGRLGAGCAGCHGTGDFRGVAPKGFDHALTRFPLRGGHGRVRCEQCHDPVKAWGKKPRFSACAACHADPHAGQATLAGKRVDCSRCHGEPAWKPAIVSLAQHARTRYPLEGRHREVACGACHIAAAAAGARPAAGRTDRWMRPAHARCGDCHADAHGGQLASSPGKGACESCHGLSGFRPSTFTRAEHEKTRLPLRGRHAEAACSSCHGPRRPGLGGLPPGSAPGPARVALKLAEADCADCHRDPHGNRFTAARRGAATTCRECHDERSFATTLIDASAHQRFSFPLEGAHRATPCALCHAELARKPSEPAASSLKYAATGGRGLEFRERRALCSECHEAANPHGEQFAARKDRGACDACHAVDSFRSMAAFDHERDTGYSLEGAHAGVACIKCHIPSPGRDGRSRVLYRPTSTRCEDCHRGAKGASRPARRAGETESKP